MTNRPLTGREFAQQHKALVDAGASLKFRIRWALRESSRWMAQLAEKDRDA